ncbi:MAG: hypothetical protein JSV09_16010 [Thermoplasmata archaeon]|nr:MAG: hypothetical protein JSV09_16010 [Thermoplasmata archaeon]
MSMNRFQGFIMIFLVLHVMMFTPNVSSDDNEMEWNEYYNFKGSCSSDNVRYHFQVNKTVVEIIVNLAWTTEGSGANLDMWVEHSEGYVVNASDSISMPEVMQIREFPNRGRWTLVVVPISCGASGEANFTANITMRNIILPKFEISAHEIKPKDSVILNLNSSYENISLYLFDFGDGTDSGWINKSSQSKFYNSSGEYYTKAKVRYSDGTESDWVEAGLIEVIEDEEELNLLLVALVSLVILSIITVIVFFIFKKRKGV